MALPIDQYLPEILQSVRDNLVTLVKAETGSGKSVYTLKAIAESGLSVFASVPTRLSASSLSSFVKSLNPDLSVGFAAEGQAMYDYKTQIVYATSGHVRRKMLGCFSNKNVKKYGLKFADVLVLDETHTKSVDVTICVSLWMEARRLGYKVPKLLLLSATPAELFIEPDPYVINIPVPTPFPVDVIYRQPDTPDDFIKEAFEIAVECYNNPRSNGDILIFVAGSKDVEDLVAMLNEALPEAICLPAYSSLDSDDLKLIYNDEIKERKIVVATNIAESSITIPRLEYVIDTLRCKEAFTSNSGAMRLQECFISKDSAKQRTGRVGRTSPGVCYRIISEAEYDLLEHHRTAEIERVPLHNIVMEFLQVGLDPTTAIKDIDASKVIDSIYLLTDIGMLEKQDDKLIVTKMGDFAPSVPLGVRSAAFLWNWIQTGYPLYPGIVIACVIDVHNVGYFYMPRRKRFESNFDYQLSCSTHINSYFSKWIGESSLETYLNMWEDFTKKVGRSLYRLTTEPFSYNYRHWSRQNSINYKQLSELVLIISQTYKVCRYIFRGKTDVNVSIFNAKQCYEQSIPLLEKAFQDKKASKNWYGKLFADSDGLTEYFFDNRRLISSVEINSKYPRSLFVLDAHEIQTKVRSMTFIDLFIPSTESKLNPHNSDSDSDFDF